MAQKIIPPTAAEIVAEAELLLLEKKRLDALAQAKFKRAMKKRKGFERRKRRKPDGCAKREV